MNWGDYDDQLEASLNYFNPSRRNNHMAYKGEIGPRVANIGRDLQLAPQNLTLSKLQYDDIVLDGSGSMEGNWWDMLNHIDNYVQSLKNNQLDSHIRMSIFTSGAPEYIDLVARNCSLADWVPLLTDPVGSYFGMTPMYDAIMQAVKRLAKLDPARAALTIVTDGDNNNSQASAEMAKRALDWCRAKGWQVTFIGCDFDNSSIAQRLGGHPAAAIGVAKARLGDAFQALAEKRAKHGKTGAPMHWSDDEKEQFGGYLTKG